MPHPASPARVEDPTPFNFGVQTLGFGSHYQKRSTIPTGNTEFNHRIGSLIFHAGDYEWLVVTGGNCARFKGTGAINGALAPNGAPIKFQIW